MSTQKIIFDFEFLTKNFVDAMIIEATFLFVKNNTIVKSFFSPITITESYETLAKKFPETLKFNKIYSQEDIDMHNQNSVELETYFKKVLDFSTSFSTTKLPLTGWICAGSDIPILKQTLSKLGFDFNKYFDYHTRDIGIVFQEFYNRFFNNSFDNHLSSAHQYLFGTIPKEKFHTSYQDCLATLDMDNWIEKQFSSFELNDLKK
jgi:hypothetical protein